MSGFKIGKHFVVMAHIYHGILFVILHSLQLTNIVLSPRTLLKPRLFKPRLAKQFNFTS